MINIDDLLNRIENELKSKYNNALRFTRYTDENEKFRIEINDVCIVLGIKPKEKLIFDLYIDELPLTLYECGAAINRGFTPSKFDISISENTALIKERIEQDNNDYKIVSHKFENNQEVIDFLVDFIEKRINVYFEKEISFYDIK